MEPLALYVDQDIQLKVLVPNLLAGAANVDMGADTALDTQLHLLLIHNLRLSCKAWKTIVNKSAEYNASRLSQYEYAMGPNDVIRVCLQCKHSLITQFQHKLMWFSHSGTSGHEFCGGFLCRTWGICHCGNWLSLGMNWRCHSMRWSSMAWGIMTVHSIGYARPIRCRWNETGVNCL
jgi:hypothetical protein